MTPDDPTGGIAHGSPDWLRMVLSMAAAGFSSFAIMNAVQPLMPQFSADFGVSAATASLSLSVTVLALAVTMLIAAPLSERFGRKRVMGVSLYLSGISMVLTALATNWEMLLALRVLCGMAIAGVPAVAIAWIADEVAPRDRATATGYYIAGAAFGGMSGRVIAGFASELLGWHGGMAVVGVLGLVTATGFAVLLPVARRHLPGARPGQRIGAGFVAILRNPVQLRLCLIGALLMGVLISVYNYLGYRLQQAPFLLGAGPVGALFLTYIVGMFSAPFAGRIVPRLGAGRTLGGASLLAAMGVLMTLPDQLVAIATGLVIFTAAFFAAHAVASGWVAQDSPQTRAQAATLYLLFYYVGGAVGGWLGGFVWLSFGWAGVALTSFAALGAAFALVPRGRDGTIRPTR